MYRLLTRQEANDPYHLEIKFYYKNKLVVRGEIYDCEGEVEIKYIESLEKRKGHATEFIKHLFEKRKAYRIYGDSLRQSYFFWDSIGAQFWRAQPTGDEDEIIFPFEILKEDFYKSIRSKGGSSA